MKYTIKANYYHYFENNPLKEAKLIDEEDKIYTLPLFLGLEGEKKIFIFEKEITEKTKIFNSAKDAGEYLDEHFNPDEHNFGSFESMFITQVEGE